ncbi:MAG: DNA methyltransferase [Pseudomonadota bacterium]
MPERFDKVEIGNATLYCGDCRVVMLRLGPVHSVITDPVWPNAPKDSVPGSNDPWGLWRSAVRTMPEFMRLITVMRCDSDPRFLAEITRDLPFLRVIQLSYAVPGRMGRVLGGDEYAYWFGAPIAFAPGRRVIPGRGPVAQSARRAEVRHPMNRPVEHFDWLVHWGSDAGETVLDPFMGSGTTGVACAKLGRPFVGIEVHRPYFEIACRRIEEAQRQGDWVSQQGVA